MEVYIECIVGHQRFYHHVIIYYECPTRQIGFQSLAPAVGYYKGIPMVSWTVYREIIRDTHNSSINRPIELYRLLYSLLYI